MTWRDYRSTDMQLFNDDCLKVLNTIAKETIDCVITDCPYHIVSGGCTKDPMKIGNYAETTGILQNRRDNHGNSYVGNTKHLNLHSIFEENDPTTYVRQGKLFKHNDIEFSEWLPEVYRVLKPNTHCYVMINARNLKDLWIAAEKAGFQFQQLIVWDKGNKTPNKYYMNAYELILMLRKGKARKINDMGTPNILRVPNITHIKKHPTEKPAELMQILVKNSTNKGETVLDPFMGVGGVGCACIENEREFIGIEIDEKYYKTAQKQLECNHQEEIRQMTIFDYVKRQI